MINKFWDQKRTENSFSSERLKIEINFFGGIFKYFCFDTQRKKTNKQIK